MVGTSQTNTETQYNYEIIGIGYVGLKFYNHVIYKTEKELIRLIAYFKMLESRIVKKTIGYPINRAKYIKPYIRNSLKYKIRYD